MAISVVGKDESIYKRVTCSKCGNILQYAPVDVKTGVSYDYTGGRDSYGYIPCPCGKEVVVRSW